MDIWLTIHPGFHWLFRQRTRSQEPHHDSLQLADHVVMEIGLDLDVVVLVGDLRSVASPLAESETPVRHHVTVRR